MYGIFQDNRRKPRNHADQETQQYDESLVWNVFGNPLENPDMEKLIQ